MVAKYPSGSDGTPRCEEEVIKRVVSSLLVVLKFITEEYTTLTSLKGSRYGPVDGAVPAGFYPSEGCSVWRTAITLSWLFSPLLAADGRVGPGAGSCPDPGDRGEERPVLYISRKLSKRETMYSTIEKECLAIRWAVLTLRYYLLGREFTLCSDHAPLQWLHPPHEGYQRADHPLVSGITALQFKVIHRLGTQMTVADFLSRNGGGGGGCRLEGFPAWVGRWGYVARRAWFSEVCSGRKTQETAVSKWVKCKMRNTCVWLQ